MNKIVAICLLHLLLYSYGALSTNIQTNETEYLLFIGNPGVGKSALINALIGESVMKSGVSAGIGLTTAFASYEHQGKFYLDTPGLADLELRVRAASEIEIALKKNGKYRIFFVLTLESGRVKAEDVATINTVMDAVKTPDATFNIIINKLTRREKKDLLDDPAQMAIVYGQINSGKHKTNNFWYAAFDRDLDDGITKFVKIDTGLHDFIFHTSGVITIAEQDIGTIETDEFEKIKSEFSKTLQILRDEIAEGNKRHAALVEEMKANQASLRAMTEALAAAQQDAKNRQDLLDKKNSEQPKVEIRTETKYVARPGCTLL